MALAASIGEADVSHGLLSRTSRIGSALLAVTRRYVGQAAVIPSRDPAKRSLPPPRTLVAIFAFPLVALTIAFLAIWLADIPVDAITRDPLATADAHPLTGLQSTVGVAIMWLAASVCLFSYGVLRGTGRRSSMATFLLWSGLFTALIAIDDQLQLHDDLIGRYILDTRERFVMIGAVVIVLVYLVAFRRQIMRTEWMLLGLGLLMLAASIGMDFVSGVAYAAAGGWIDTASITIFIEDGVKLLGITALAGYFLRLSYRALTDTAAGHPGLAVERSAGMPGREDIDG